jgi:hypothetical protein
MGYKDEARNKIEQATLNLSYVKAIRPDVDPSLLGIKRSGDTIQGYLALWGDPEVTDLEAEYFTPQTDFWDKSIQGERPLTWDHAVDQSTKADPIIGRITDIKDDEIGRWYTDQLDRNHRYYRAISRLLEQNALGTSSDSVPQYVLREARGKAIWLKRWPLIAAALTPTPCEPRMLGTIDYVKSLGIELPEPEAAQEAARFSTDIARMRIDLLRILGD